MAVKAIVASSLVIASAEKVALTYTDCGSSSTHAKITALKPDTIDVPGKATIVGSGDLDSDQTSASFSLKVKKGLVPLVSGKGSICEDTTIKIPLGAGSFTVKGIDCPVKQGSVDVEVDLDVADLFDAWGPFDEWGPFDKWGPFDDGENSLLSIHIEANADDTGDQVICLDVEASLAAAPTLKSNATVETNTCSADIGYCGKAYQACCAGYAVKGFPCGCSLADGSGESTGDCGTCGASYQLCCDGFKAQGNACQCDVAGAASGISV